MTERSDDARQLETELDRLPGPLAEAGRDFMRRIRAASPGFLKRMKSGQYNYPPLEFFALEVQPKDESIRVTVYGKPPAFGRPSRLTLSPDQKSYTRFKIRSPADVEEAVAVTLKAARLKEEYRAGVDQ